MFVSGVTGFFGSYTDTLSPGNPTKADQIPACVQVAFYCPHCSPLFNQIHLEAFFSMFLPMALFRLAPVMPSITARRPLLRGVTGKSAAAHLYWHTPAPPSIPLTIIDQLLVFLPLSLLSLLHPLLPGHCQLQQDQLFCGLRDQMMSGLNLDWVMCVGIFSCLSRVNCHCPVPGCESKPTEQFFDAFSGFCPSLMK